MQITLLILVFSIAQKVSMLIIDLKHAFLFVLLNGHILDSFILLLVYLYASRDSLQMRMLGEHAGQLAQMATMQIALQEHALSIAVTFVLSGMKITQRDTDSVLMSALDRAMHLIVIKHVEHRFLSLFNQDVRVATMLIGFQSSV